MISLTADDSRLLKDVRLFIEPVEVYDTRGKLLGLFVPANLERGKQMQARLAGLFDPAEIKRRLQANEPGGTLEQFWKWIRELEAEMKRRKAVGERDFTTEEVLAYFRSLRRRDQQEKNLSEGEGSLLEKEKCPIP